MGSHSFTCHPTQVNAPALTAESKLSWYSIYLPWRDGRLSQARREPQRKTLSRGPIPPFCMFWDRSRGRIRGEKCPLTIRLRVRGSVVSAACGVRGGAPVENGFYAYFRSERSHLEHHNSVFLSDSGAPKRRGKTSPSRRAWAELT